MPAGLAKKPGVAGRQLETSPIRADRASRVRFSIPDTMPALGDDHLQLSHLAFLQWFQFRSCMSCCCRTTRRRDISGAFGSIRRVARKKGPPAWEFRYREHRDGKTYQKQVTLSGADYPTETQVRR